MSVWTGDSTLGTRTLKEVTPSVVVHGPNRGTAGDWGGHGERSLVTGGDRRRRRVTGRKEGGS